VIVPSFEAAVGIFDAQGALAEAVERRRMTKVVEGLPGG
jgi:hypothetical protein